MPDPTVSALKVLGHFWLEELRAGDLEVIAALPELSETLPDLDAGALDELAVEYQRLFGFNLPPYESVFVDPSAMLMAPATGRVQQLYQAGPWRPAAGLRAGAPDHLGMELLALADWLAAERTDLAHRLHSEHLALWVPPFILALQRLNPHPFYQTLADLTLDLILATLPVVSQAAKDLLPNISLGPTLDTAGHQMLLRSDPDAEDTVTLRDVVKRLLPPCRVGLFLTREDLAQISEALDLPVIMGERFRMLESLFRQAGQYDLLGELFAQLQHLLLVAAESYRRLAGYYPNWTPYALAWQEQTAATIKLLEGLAEVSTQHSE